MQAYAYLMSMPGIPCVFYPHWAVYKEEISQMIALRKRVGIHSESQVLEETSGLYKYGARVQGHRGQVFVTVGKNRNQLDVPEGFEQVMDGDHYTLYVQEGAQSVENVQRGREQGTKVIENGVLYLKYKGATYNVQGMRVE
jgi:alpha-amylase